MGLSQERTYHPWGALLVEDRREDEGGNGARHQGEVGVERCPVLGIVEDSGGRGEARPEDPQVDGSCRE